MKKLFILSAMALGGLVYTTADAQIRVGLNLGYRPQSVTYSQPAVPATPAYGDSNDDYYYLPDLGVYYDVNDQCYFYFDGTEWVSSPYLPGEYANYDWRNARRFEVRAFRPYLHDDFYRARYNGNRFADCRRENDRDHFDGGYANHRYGDHSFSRPAQPYRPDHQHFDSRGPERPQKKNRDRGADNRGGDNHFAQNHKQSDFANRKMSKF